MNYKGLSAVLAVAGLLLVTYFQVNAAVLVPEHPLPFDVASVTFTNEKGTALAARTVIRESEDSLAADIKIKPTSRGQVQTYSGTANFHLIWRSTSTVVPHTIRVRFSPVAGSLIDQSGTTEVRSGKDVLHAGSADDDDRYGDLEILPLIFVECPVTHDGTSYVATAQVPLPKFSVKPASSGKQPELTYQILFEQAVSATR